MLSTLLNRACNIIRRTESGNTDDYGNDIPDEDIVATVCELQSRNGWAGRSEPALQGQLSDTEWLLVLPPGTVLSTADVVEVDGQEYEVTGDPWHARNPRNQTESHVEASVRRTAAAGDAS